MHALDKVQVEVHVVGRLAPPLRTLLLRRLLRSVPLHHKPLGQQLLELVVGAQLVEAGVRLRHQPVAERAEAQLGHGAVEEDLGLDRVGLVDAVLQVAHEQHVARSQEAVVQRMVIHVAQHGARAQAVVAVAVDPGRELCHEGVAVGCAVAALRRHARRLGHQRVVLVVDVLQAPHRQPRRHASLAGPRVVVLHELRELKEGCDVEQPLDEVGRVVVQQPQAEVQLVVETLHERNQVRCHLDPFLLLEVGSVRASPRPGRLLASSLFRELGVFLEHVQKSADVDHAACPQTVVTRGCALHVEAYGHVRHATLHRTVELRRDKMHQNLSRHRRRNFRRRQHLQLRNLITLRRALLATHTLDLVHLFANILLRQHQLLRLFLHFHILILNLTGKVLLLLLLLLLILLHLLKAVIVITVSTGLLEPLGDTARLISEFLF
mmetsp:Transcript_71206/g.190099  ORF Transcript_71206/g.190099 Transcript_71206/m.190099 type:complete len:436 (-) Transcript_71206:711-2018(-)